MTQVKTTINGIAVDCVDTSDRGLLYGDGLFETMAVKTAPGDTLGEVIR